MHIIWPQNFSEFQLVLATLFRHRHPQLIGEFMLYHVREPLELNFLTQFECRWPFVMASIGYGSVRCGSDVQNCLLIGALHFLPVQRQRKESEGEGKKLCAVTYRRSPQALWEIIKIAFENAVYIDEGEENRGREGWRGGGVLNGRLVTYELWPKGRII